MNPRLILLLWRERWGKSAGTTLKVPYVHGKINRWTDWIPQSAVWSVKGVPIVAMVSCLLLIGLLMSVNLSFDDQVAFSILFICIALYIRRYAGTLITLMLISMAMIASTRYLYWRFDATLVPGLNLNFMFGFYLWVAECYLALLVLTRLIQFIWPLKRSSALLPLDQDSWPTVDVFILCDDQPYASIKLTCVAATKLDWPRNKIKTYLIDGAQRDDLFVLAASAGAHYLPHADASRHHMGFINRSLPSTNGEFIAVLESGELPDQYFLQSSVGWFLRDQKLGMVQTPHHLLAPGLAARELGTTDLSVATPSFALMRRSAITDLDDIDAATATPNAHMTVTLQASGYTSAYVGFGERELPSKENWDQNIINEATSNPSFKIFLVEHLFADWSMRLKLRIQSFHNALQFYYPVPRFLFFAAPVIYFLDDVQSSPVLVDFFVAYVVPHFVLAHIVLARTDEKNRLKLFADIRETVLAWYLMMLTTLTLLGTELKQCLARWTSNKPDPSTRSYMAPEAAPTSLFAPLTFLRYVLVLSLNSVAFLAGMGGLIFSNTGQQEVTALYGAWAAYNLMLLAATLATAEEARQVLKHTSSQQHLPAMIKLPSGRTVSCNTENFPASVLGLSLPMLVEIQEGAPVSLSIFHAHRELVFPAVVVLQRDLKLVVRIAVASQKNYQSLIVAVLSRGPDWPKWLPGCGADQPLPKWLINAFIGVSIAALDFVTNINKHLHWARLDSWIQVWKRKK